MRRRQFSRLHIILKHPSNILRGKLYLEMSAKEQVCFRAYMKSSDLTYRENWGWGSVYAGWSISYPFN